MKKIILPNPYLGFVPIGTKPNVYVSDTILNKCSIEIFDNNYVVVENKLAKLIEDLSLEIIFPYDYKSLPGKNIDSNYVDVSYKINDRIYDIADLYHNYININCIDLLPYMNISEEDLFYLKLNSVNIAFMD